MTEDQQKQPDGVDEPFTEVVEEEEAEPSVETAVNTDWEGLAANRYDQLVRLQADFENFRRRVDRERVEAEAQTIGKLLSALLPVYDNLERAVRFMPTEGDAKAWRVGVEMTLKGFNEALERLGVEVIATVGEKFDPRLHEAIQQAPSEFADGVVAEELQKGFRWRERILRAALVKVSTGPEVAVEEPLEESGDEHADFEA